MVFLECPFCGKTVEFSSEEIEQIKKKKKIYLKCCDKYLSKTVCLYCREQLYLTEEEVEKALEGQKIQCPKCQKFFVPKEHDVGGLKLNIETTIYYDLSPVFGWEEEKAYLERIKDSGLFSSSEVALYHVSSMTRLSTAKKSLEELERMNLLSPIGLIHREALNADLRASEGTSDLDALLFVIVSNLSSFLDMLAQEINYIIWVSEPNAAFDPIQKVKIIDFDSLGNKVKSPNKIGSILAEVQQTWERNYLRELRNTLQHRFLTNNRVLVSFPMKKIFHPRPQAITPERVLYFLPDDPSQPPNNFTFDQGLELKATIHRLYNFCEDTAKKIYASLP